jgi:hypothetical protein
LTDWLQADSFTSRLPLEGWLSSSKGGWVESLDLFPETDEKGMGPLLSVGVDDYVGGGKWSPNSRQITYSANLLMWADENNPPVIAGYSIDQPDLFSLLSTNILAALYRRFCGQP